MTAAVQPIALVPLVDVQITIDGPAAEDIAALDPAPERRRARGKGRCRWWLARPWRGVGDRVEYLPLVEPPAERDARLPTVTLRATLPAGGSVTVGCGMLSRYDVTVPAHVGETKLRAYGVRLVPVTPRHAAAIDTCGTVWWATADTDADPPDADPYAVLGLPSPTPF